MNEFRFIDIGIAEFVRNLGRMQRLRELTQPIRWEDFGWPLPTDSVRAIWMNRDGLNSEFPLTLIGSEISFSNLLPKLLALPSNVMPISSFMKTWLIEDFQIGNANVEKPLSRVAALGFIGIILAELRETIGPKADFKLMGMDSVRRTLSFVLAQSVMKGWKYGSINIILERWFEASALTSNEVDVDSLVFIAKICEFLQTLSDIHGVEETSPQTLAFHIQFWLEAQIGPNQRDLLGYSLPQVVSALTGVNSREKRYDLIVESLARLNTTNETAHSLERGFLISLIEPGSFEFLDLAKQLDPKGRGTAFAYSAFAAIWGKEATLGKFNGFGWNVFNCGLQPSTELPIDVSLAELRILHDTRRSAPISFRTRSPALFDVEIAPMVSGSFGNTARRRLPSANATEEANSMDRDDVLRESLATALRAVENAYGILQHGKHMRRDSPAIPRGRMKR